jgi:hypothetical protein
MSTSNARKDWNRLRGSRACIRLLALVAGVTIAASAPAVASQSFVIRASSHPISVGRYTIGIGVRNSPTYARAIKAFGAPQACALQKVGKQKPADNYGRATWRTLGLRMDFITYGGIPNGGDACSVPESVYLDTLWITGAQWSTLLGLRVGATVATLQRLYPKALPHGNSFWLITGKNVIGTELLYPIFSATISHGRVSSFVFRIGAEGD